MNISNKNIDLDRTIIVKRHYILYFLFLAIFIQFSPLDEYIRVTQTTNSTPSNYIITFTVIFFILLFLFRKFTFNKKAFKIIFILICLYLINYIFAPYRNSSWFLYEIVFLLITAYTATVYAHIASSDYKTISKNIEKICNVGLFVIFLILTYLLVNYHNALIDIFIAGNTFNQYIRPLYLDFYWDKHASAGMIAIVICHIFTLPENKYRNCLLIFPALPFAMASRHLLLGFFLTIIFLRIKSVRNYLLIFTLFLILSLLFWDNIYELLLKDTRINSFANTFDIITKYPFGVGNGRYHTYVDEYLTNRDFYWGYEQAGLPSATETDIVYIFGSFGLLFGIIYYSILTVILFKIKKLYLNIAYPDKFFALVFVYFFFAGIGEDWIFSYPYWILFGFALGVVTAKRNRGLLFQN